MFLKLFVLCMYIYKEREDITWPRGDMKFLFDLLKNISRVSADKFSNVFHKSDNHVFFLCYVKIAVIML